jgi:hypothetical protein
MVKIQGMATALALGVLLAMPGMPARADLLIQVDPSLAPNAFGSPSYDAYVSNATTALETGVTSYGTQGTPAYYQQLANNSTISANQVVVTGFPSWLGQANPGTAFGPAFANELGNRLLFGLVITSTDPSQTFSISDLSFTATTTDTTPAPNNLAFSFATGSYSYSNQYVGVIYGAGGASNTSTWTYVTSGPNTQQVNAIYGRGSGNAYAVYNDGSGTPLQTQLDNAISAIPTQSLTGTYSIDGVTGSATININAVQDPDAVAPEPSTLASACVGVLALGLVAWRRKRCSVVSAS